MNNIPESDWKYLTTIKDELLGTLCKDINDAASKIIHDPLLSQHEKFLRLFRHINESNEVVAKCFDDWRRANILFKLLWLREQHLLTEMQLSRLSAETRRKISQM
jgi:hypothetical protein